MINGQDLLKSFVDLKLKKTESAFPVFFCGEDECVVYNQLTGSTHLINGIGTEIFRAISENASTRSDLLQNLDSIFDFPVDFDVEGFLDNLILEYHKLGLLDVMENSLA